MKKKNPAAQALRSLAKDKNMKRGDSEHYRTLAKLSHLKRKAK